MKRTRKKLPLKTPRARKRQPAPKPPSRPSVPSVTSRSENFGLFFLSSIYGAIFFGVYLAQYNDQHPLLPGNVVLTYQRLFIMGWLLSVSTALAAGLFWGLLRKRYPKETCLYALLSLFNLGYAFHFYSPGHWNETGHLYGFLLWQPLVAVLARVFDLVGKADVKNNALYFLMIPLGLVWLNGLYPDWYHIDDWTTFNKLFFTAIAAFLLFLVRPVPQPSRNPFSSPAWDRLKNFLSYALALLMICLTMSTVFAYEEFHYTFYLAPVADLSAGKSLLVNIPCQYGILVIYFLRFCFLFLPLGFTSFSLILTLLTIIQYWLFFFVVRHLFRSELLAFFSLMVLLMINHLAQDNGPGILYPSVGPLRFGFIYVLMALVLFRNRYPSYRDLILKFEALAVGVAFFWSLETCVYVLVSYLPFLIYESWHLEGKPKFDLKQTLARIVQLVLSVLSIGALFYLDVFRRAHQWPDWAYYLGCFGTYQNGLGSLVLAAPDYWWLVVCILYFSFFAITSILIQRRRKVPEDMNAIVLLFLYGVLQFTYYFHRTHYNNLLHVSMPVVLLGIYWMYFVRRYELPSMPTALKKWGYVTAALLAAFFLQKAALLDAKKFGALPPPSEMIGRVLNVRSLFKKPDPVADQAAQLMEKYSGKVNRLVYFLGESGLDLSLATGRVNLYPYNEPVLATVVPVLMDKIMNFDPQLKRGDYVYVGPLKPEDFENKLWNKLNTAYDLELVEQSGSVSAYRVEGEKASPEPAEQAGKK